MPLATYRAWKHKNGAIGCVFARFLAARPGQFGQREAVVQGRDAQKVASELADLTTAWVDDKTAFAGAIICPDLTDLTSVVELALALDSQQHWAVTRSLLTETPGGPVVAFNIVRNIPMGTAYCPSEVLVLGPFPEFPNTRRAPVTALELFVGEPPPLQRSGEVTTKAHLADVPIELPAPSVYETMFTGTKALRLRSLGGKEDLRAKAKVSLSIPIALATSLSCAP
jgi:hypothetical protein